MNGTEAVVSELAWLREQGVEINGVVAHNSAPAYGAENFEMFQGLALNDRTSVTHNGVEMPLQTLSLSEQGIHYEGNFSLPPKAENNSKIGDYISDLSGADIRSRSWQVLHFLNNPTFERNYEVSIWLLAEDSWLMAVHGEDEGRFGKRRIYWPLTTQSLKQHLIGLQPGNRIMINIHPEYLAL